MRRFVLLCVLLSCVVARADFTASLMSDYETIQGTFVWSPDPNGGVGVKYVTDSIIPDGTNDNFAVGPYVEFNMGDLTSELAGRLIPGTWNPIKTAPAQIYGTLSFLWEINDDQHFTFVPGSRIVLFPSWKICPVVDLQYFQPVGDSTIDEDFKTLLGFMYKF